MSNSININIRTMNGSKRRSCDQSNTEINYIKICRILIVLPICTPPPPPPPPIFENKNNSGLEESKSKTWSVINEVIYKTEHNIKGIKATSLDGKQLNGPQNIAVSFNNFFVNIGPSLTKNARHISEKTFQMHLNWTILTALDLIDVSNLDRILQSLLTKTSSGHDGISVELLKYLAPALRQPLTLIINQSSLNGIFPEKLK